MRPGTDVPTSDPDGASPEPRLSPAPQRVLQGDPTLDLRLAALDRERAAMKTALGTHPQSGKHQMDVRRALVEALEAYAAALGTRNLPVPPRLRDELFLQRGLVSRSDSLGRPLPTRFGR